jgi:DNA anti-recombination protein RmuC
LLAEEWRMADKKGSPTQDQINTTSQTSELDTLRHIVFGVAKADIEQRLSELSQMTSEHFLRLEQQMAQQTKQLQNAMEDGLQRLEQQLAVADQNQDKRSDELNVYADKISSELEMAEANNKQENDELHQRIDKEIKQLTDSFNEQLHQALAKLNQVSNELNTSKTDRKTLAKLLTTVATNLETDVGE